MRRNLVITCSGLRLFGGAEVVAKDIALAARGLGWEPLLFASDVGSPFSEVLDSLGIPWTDRIDDDRFSEADAVWVHHCSLPGALIDRVLDEPRVLVVYSHLGPWHPREAPRSAGLESARADVILSVSDETKNVLVDSYGLQREKVQLFPNCAFQEVWNRGDERLNDSLGARRCEMLAVMSNHIPTELREGVSLLPGEIVVEAFGREDRYGLIEDDDVVRFDAVVSSGRTVFQAIALGVPVYVYDHFGGPGWLTRENVGEVLAHNCSGRPFGTKDAETVAREIAEGYASAVADLGMVRSAFDHCRTEPLVASVLSVRVEEPVRVLGPEAFYEGRIARAISDDQDHLLRVHAAADERLVMVREQQELLDERLSMILEQQKVIDLQGGILADRDRILGELEQVRGERDAYASRRANRVADVLSQSAHRVLGPLRRRAR